MLANNLHDFSRFQTDLCILSRQPASQAQEGRNQHHGVAHVRLCQCYADRDDHRKIVINNENLKIDQHLIAYLV